jgi:hypothetical protein
VTTSDLRDQLQAALGAQYTVDSAGRKRLAQEIEAYRRVSWAIARILRPA